MCLLCSRRDLEAKAGYSMSSPEGCVSDTEQSCLCSSNQEVFSPNFGLRESVKFPKDFGMWHEVAKVFFFFCSVHLSRVRLFATPWTAHTSLPCPSLTSEATQTHVHQVGDAIQPSHPLLSPSPPAFNLSQHHGLFQWVSWSHQMVNVLEINLQHQSFC